MILFLSVAAVFLFVGLCFVCYIRDVDCKRLTKNVEQVHTSLEAVRGDRDHYMAQNDVLKKENDQRLASLRREHADKLAEKDARVEKIVGELSEVQWTRDLRNREQYCVTIMVNPRMFGGFNSRFERDDLMQIARYIGDQVAHELASYKYITKANDFERRYR